MDSLAAGRLSTDTTEISWQGAVTWRDTPGLRDQLLELLNTSESTSLRIDVRQVTSIDNSGVALLVRANRQAAATGRMFVLIDSAGAVSQALSRMHLLTAFLVTEVVQADIDLTGIGRTAGRS
jgi:anti-anti-sigma factor